MKTHTRQTFARFFLITAFACLLASCSACAVSMAGAQTTVNISNMNGSIQVSKEEEPKSTVFGRAIYDNTGRPVRRARVLLLDADGHNSERSGLTNASGEFRIKNVHAGSYFTAVDAAGIVSPVSLLDVRSLKSDHLDLSVVREQFEEIDVDGKRDKEITVRARRGAAIGGKVTYADGDPAINVPVTIMRRQADGKSLTQTFVGLSPETMLGMKTDDRGMFRVAGLPPGEYLVAVSEMVEHGESKDRRYGGMESLLLSDAQMMTFYPSATRAKAATPVRVEAGEERGDVDITIAERGLHTLSGVVRGGRDGRPVANASISFTSKESGAKNGNDISLLGDESSRTSTQTDAQGRWQLNEMPDGVYLIAVEPPSVYGSSVTTTESEDVDAPPRPSKQKKGYAPKNQEVKIAGSDVTEVTIVLADAGRISGTYTHEGQQGASAGYEYVSLYVETGDGKKLASGGGSGGKFTIERVPPGKLYLRDGAYRSEGEKTYVKSMTWRGRDLLREPLDIAEGTEIEGVQVVLASDMATLELHTPAATDKNARRGVVVLLVSTDPAQWSKPDARAACNLDRAGACSINSAPGDYLVIVLAPGGHAENLEAAIRERAPNAPRVTLRANERRPFEVSVPGVK